MKRYTFLSLCFCFFFAITIVSAERFENNFFLLSTHEPNGDRVQTSIPVYDVQALGFACSEAQCSALSTFLWPEALSSSTDILPGNDTLQIKYPTTLLSPHGYALYFYKEGYIPYEVMANWSGTDANDPIGPFPNYLSKKRVCTPTIDTTVTSFSGGYNATISVKSPIQHAGPLSVVPSQLADQYTVEVLVTLTDTVGNTTMKQEKKLKIPFSTTEKTSFTVPAVPGAHSVTLAAAAIDEKCINTTIETLTTAVFVPSPLDTTPPGPVSALRPFVITSSSITWIWDNPLEQDFSHSIIYIDGIQSATTQFNLYTASNLQPDSLHTITINTVDVAGNVNMLNVTNIQRTLSSGNQTSLLPTLRIVSPLNTTYTSQSVQVILEATNAAELRFSVDGIEQIYVSPITLGLSAGTHTLVATASNSQGSVTSSVTFTVSPQQETAPRHTSSRKKNTLPPLTIGEGTDDEGIVVAPMIEEEPTTVKLSPLYKKQSFSYINWLLLLAILLALAIIVTLASQSRPVKK